MKTALVVLTVCATVLLASAIAAANPDMLPKHPGYPMGKALDPVNGQSLANDPGQTNARGEWSLGMAASFDDAHAQQKLSSNENDERILDKPGAGLLPKVEGPNITIEPPVKEGMKVNTSPH